MRLRRLTLRFLIILLVLFTVVGVLSTYLLFRQIDELVSLLGEQYALERAEAARGRLLAPLQRDAALARQLAASPTIQRWMRNEEDPRLRREAFAELESFRESFSDSNYFVAIDESLTYYNQPAEGDLVVEALSPSEASDGWYFRTLTVGEELSFNLDYNPTLDASIVFVNSLITAGDETLGIGGTGLEITQVINRILTAGGTGATTMLANLNGSILAHQDPSIMEHNARNRGGSEQITIYDRAAGESDRETLRRLVADALAGLPAVAMVDLEGRTSLVAMRPILQIDAMMVATVDPSTFVSVADFAPLFGLLVLSILIALAIMALAMERMILSPLALMTDSADRIATGDYELTIPIDRQDEMGELAGSLMTMAGRIAEYTSNLEELVAERTEELTEANSSLEKSNREILESIRYARLLQQGVMSLPEELTGRFASFDLVHRQRDLVGGDFLFLRGTPARFLLAVIDCEGHGVPGALMTMMVDSLLRQISADRLGEDPAVILGELEAALQEIVGSGEVNSGLDIALCSCRPGEGRILFSAAAMPLYLRERDGTITPVAGRSRAIRNYHRREPKPFESMELSTEGRAFFLLTDGWTDQPGGSEARAYGTRRLREFLATLSPERLSRRNDLLATEIERYQDQEPQRDDILGVAFTFPSVEE